METMNGHERNLYNAIKTSINANHYQDAIGVISNAMFELVYNVYSISDTKKEYMPDWLKAAGDCTVDELYVALENAIEGFPCKDKQS